MKSTSTGEKKREKKRLQKKEEYVNTLENIYSEGHESADEDSEEVPKKRKIPRWQKNAIAECERARVAKIRRDKDRMKNGTAEEKANANKLKKQAKELTKVKEVNGSFEFGHEP